VNALMKSAPPPRLTLRQQETLRLLSLGLRNSEIAHQLYLSERTVKECVSRLLLVFEATNRTELAVLWLREGGEAAMEAAVAGPSVRTGQMDGPNGLAVRTLT